MAAINVPQGWSTAAELQFIGAMATRDNAIGLLRGYIEGMQKRAHLTDIDATLCIQVAKQHFDEQVALLAGGKRRSMFA